MVGTTKAIVVDLGTRTLEVEAPQSPRDLVLRALRNRPRAGVDTELPFWGRIWPSSIALGRVVCGEVSAEHSVVELGAGLGVASLAAATTGASVLATDREPEALQLVKRSADRAGLSLETAVLDWDRPGTLGRQFARVLVADVLLEPDVVEPLCGVVGALLAPDGEALVADPWFPHHAALEQAFERRGLVTRRVPLELEWEGAEHVTHLFRCRW